MARMIFVNLPVRDVRASRAFFTALGFGVNETFSDERTACIVVEDNISVMLLEHDRFADFIHGGIAPQDTTEVLLCLSADSREDVDRMLATALASGGSAWKPTLDQGPMYGASFADPDGHVWEVVHMDLSQVPAADAGMVSA